MKIQLKDDYIYSYEDQERGDSASTALSEGAKVSNYTYQQHFKPINVIYYILQFVL